MCKTIASMKIDSLFIFFVYPFICLWALRRKSPNFFTQLPYYALWVHRQKLAISEGLLGFAKAIPLTGAMYSNCTHGAEVVGLLCCLHAMSWVLFTVWVLFCPHIVQSAKAIYIKRVKSFLNSRQLSHLLMHPWTPKLILYLSYCESPAINTGMQVSFPECRYDPISFPFNSWHWGCCFIWQLLFYFWGEISACLLVCLFVCLLVWDGLSLCSSSWPRTYNINEDDLKLTQVLLLLEPCLRYSSNPLTFTSPVYQTHRLQACITMPAFYIGAEDSNANPHGDVTCFSHTKPSTQPGSFVLFNSIPHSCLCSLCSLHRGPRLFLLYSSQLWVLCLIH